MTDFKENMSIIAQLSLVIFLLSVLTIFVCTFINFVQSKPLERISLIDLVNMDLARTYYMATLLAVIPNIIRILEIKHVPVAVAILLTYMTSCFTTILIAYISISSIAHYFSVKLKASRFDEWFTDEQVRDLLFYFVSGPTFFTYAILAVYHGPGKTFNLYHAMVGDDERDTDTDYPISRIVFTILSAIAVITNVTLRILIHLERKKIANNAFNNKTKPPYGTYITISVILIIMASLGTLSFAVRRLIILTVVTVMIPTFVLGRNKNLRAHVRRRLKQNYPEIMAKMARKHGTKVGRPSV